MQELLELRVVDLELAEVEVDADRRLVQVREAVRDRAFDDRRDGGIGHLQTASRRLRGREIQGFLHPDGVRDRRPV